MTHMTRIAEHVAKKTPGAGPKDVEHQIDMARMRQYRLARTRADNHHGRDLSGSTP